MVKDGSGQRKSGRKDAPLSLATTRAARAASLAKNPEKANPAIKAAAAAAIEPDPPAKHNGPLRRRIKKQTPPCGPEDLLPDDFQAIFGENLKAARLKSGLKQSDVAEKAGLTQQRLSQIENGHQNLTLKTMVKLAAVVDHHISALLLKVKTRRGKG